ncbi:MAG: hypothetical protein V4494_05905 [Chlamydiota bacterium]
MKRIAFLTIMLLAVGCTRNGVSDDNYLDAKIADDKYSVIYIEKEKTSREEARNNALTHAAKIAKDNGFRYFVIDSDEDVMVAHSDTSQNPFPNNLYQEEIVEGNFGRQALQNKTPQPTNLYPGVKIKITCYREMPSVPTAIDVCQILNCD